MAARGEAEEPEEEVGAPRPPPWLGDATHWLGVMSLVGYRMGCRSRVPWSYLVFLPWAVLQPHCLHPCGVSPRGKALCFSPWIVSHREYFFSRVSHSFPSWGTAESSKQTRHGPKVAGVPRGG